MRLENIQRSDNPRRAEHVLYLAAISIPTTHSDNYLSVSGLAKELHFEKITFYGTHCFILADLLLL